MPRGGKREGAGRKPGSAAKLTREIANGAAEAGETPLEYMLRVLRDPSVDHDRRDKMAMAAARFVHPTLSSAEYKNITPKLTEAELDARIRDLIAALGVEGGTGSANGAKAPAPRPPITH